MEQKLIISGVCVLIVGLVATIGALWGYGAGYRHAAQDYVEGNIDCIIRVQYPELLKKSLPGD